MGESLHQQVYPKGVYRIEGVLLAALHTRSCTIILRGYPTEAIS